MVSPHPSFVYIRNGCHLFLVLRTCRPGSICLSWSFDHRSVRPSAESTKEDQRFCRFIPVRASTKEGRVFGLSHYYSRFQVPIRWIGSSLGRQIKHRSSLQSIRFSTFFLIDFCLRVQSVHLYELSHLF